MSTEGVTKRERLQCITVEGKIQIIQMKKFLSLPRGFFFRMVAPLNLVEVNRPSPHDLILLT
jgi:hypothetical protein